MLQTAIIHHYPPDLMGQLVDLIPLLCRSKRDVLLFFRGAGVAETTYTDVAQRVESDRSSISKFEIVRTVLERLNDRGEATLRERREVVRRVVEFEDFGRCWERDRLKAKGLVSDVRDLVNKKDSFTRMKQERDRESRERRAEYQRRVEDAAAKKRQMSEIKKDLYSLFSFPGQSDERGRLLESVLGRLFEAAGILVREAFTRRSDETGRALEQIDGVVEIDGHLYLVEMKWLKDPVSKDDVSNHLVGVYHRGAARSIFISATGFTEAARKIYVEALQKTVAISISLKGLVRLLEREGDLKEAIRSKIRVAMLDKDPFKSIE